VLLEQPFPEKSDAILATLPRPVPICADESAHDAASLDALVDRYDAVNVKLDKTGGLTEALDVVERAHALGLDVALGCMVCTSLALAPAFALAARADFVDLDGALFLEQDREGGVVLEDGGVLCAPARTLWAG
jgi:L-alanine-DL-glutamate epimerase-like enolase superfamily enzyme